MDVMVVVAVAAAVVILAVDVLVVRQFLRAFRRLRGRLADAGGTIRGRLDDMQQDVAVTSTELAALHASVERLRRRGTRADPALAGRD